MLRNLLVFPAYFIDLTKTIDVSRSYPQLPTTLAGLCITYFNPHFSPEEPATTLCARFTKIRSVN
jgi:hypothetical protein